MAAAFALVFCRFIAPPAIAAPPSPAMDTRSIGTGIDNGSLFLARNNVVILEHNADTLLIPASIFKIPTALAALEILGSDYRFQTEFFLDQDGNLYIKGYGDPFLTSEEVSAILDNLQQRGIAEINSIILDDQSFQLENRAAGADNHDNNPYNAGNSSVPTNFNTLNILVTDNHQIVSGEPQTPTLPLMQTFGRDLLPGVHRINIPGSQQQFAIHSGQLFAALQKKKNITGSGRIMRGKVPVSLPVFYTHFSSHTLQEIIAAMMRYSNNFIANQLFLTIGAHERGYPATWLKSRTVFDEYFHNRLKISEEHLIIEEGSGLSRKNRLTASAMRTILARFAPHMNLLPEENDTFIKSGTLTGVYTYAGYFRQKKSIMSFALILNQKNNNRQAILQALKNYSR